MFDLKNPLELEAFQRLIVGPLVDSMKSEVLKALAVAQSEVASLQAELAEMKEGSRLQQLDINALKKNQSRALVGFGFLTVVLTYAWSYVRDWLRANWHF